MAAFLSTTGVTAVRRGRAMTRSRRMTVLSAAFPATPFGEDLVAGGLENGDLVAAKPKAVVFLRQPTEGGVSAEEKQAECEANGIPFGYFPVAPATAAREDADKIVDFVKEHGGPVLYECGSAMRASAAASIVEAREEGLDYATVLQMAKERGGRWVDAEPLQNWVEKSI